MDTSQYFEAQGDEAPLASSPPDLGMITLDGKINKGEKVKKLGEPSKSKDMVHRARKPPDEPSSPSSSSSDDDENDDDKRRDKKKKGRGREPSSSDGSDNDKNKIRRRKKKESVSSDSDSVRSSKIGSGTSTTELLMFANKVYYNAKHQLDEGENNKEILLELKRVVIQASDKIVRYGDLGDRLTLKMND